MCADGFPIKDFGNDGYYRLLFIGIGISEMIIKESFTDETR
jgi:hypothetical protein